MSMPTQALSAQIRVLSLKHALAPGCGFPRTRRSKICVPHSLLITSIAILTLCISPSAATAELLYVANGTNNTIERFTDNGISSAFATTGLNAPRGLAFDKLGNLYV